MDIGVSLLPLANSERAAYIDTLDLPLVEGYKWFTYKLGRKNWYVMTTDSDGKRLYLHRLLAGEQGLDVDHRNGNGLDNRRRNLRAIPHALNLANQRPQEGRMSRYKGVSRRPSGRWHAYIKVNQQMSHLGTYDTQEQAAAAYNAAALDAWGEFARLNVLDQPLQESSV